jgi:single-strand selective monofunctional uracil DNA glycosylase
MPRSKPVISTTSAQLIVLAKELSHAVDKLRFQPPVAYVYNPLEYAWKPHHAYLTKYAKATCKVLFLGMNPGPFGMAQTGVPFGEIAAVRDWLGIDEPVGKPASEHPKRRIEGFACKKSEVSGKRLWGLFAERHGSPESFFEEHFVVNYCPLVFMDEGARNVTPDKLHREDMLSLQDVCDTHLRKVIQAIGPVRVVGVGGYAEDCLKRILGAESEIQISRILHPSPASPAANKDWAGQVTKQLTSAGIW